MLSIGLTVLNVRDMARAVTFWRQALGYELREGGPGEDWSSLSPPGGPGTGLGLQLSDREPEPHPSVHLDLYASDAAEQAAEVERLVSLGARRVDWDLYPGDPDFVVLADTEGNRFCVVDISYGSG
jgi:predicted enzyme related to lactoylglutathione lyase